MRTAKTLPLVLLTAAVVCAWSSAALGKPELTHTRLFENHDKVVYRIPALAISQETKRKYHLSYSPEVDFSTAGYFAAYFGRLLMEKSLPSDVCVLKVDVPCEATPDTPWEITRLSRKIYYQPTPPERDSWDQPGIPSYQVVGDPNQDRPDSDVYTVRVKGVVSVTPLSLDLTSRIDLKELETYLQEK